MPNPEWLDELVTLHLPLAYEGVGYVFETEETDDYHRVHVWPESAHYDTRLDVGVLASHFDEVPTMQWHMEGDIPAALHVEGVVLGHEVWLSFYQEPKS